MPQKVRKLIPTQPDTRHSKGKERANKEANVLSHCKRMSSDSLTLSSDFYKLGK